MSILVNFGGPRNLEEVLPFLTELLTDRDLIRTKLPPFLQTYLFKRVARKRSFKIRQDYAQIGGKSPIYFDTEEIATRLSAIPFHRYLPQTHKLSLAQIEAIASDEIRVLPLFPQFCYATTGSIARFFQKNLTKQTLNKLRWIKSYASHPAFIRSYQRRIEEFLQEKGLRQEETALLFSAHGVPRSFIEEGDPYESECQKSYREVMKAFPLAFGQLSYQSKFGPEEWTRPYTNEVCEQAAAWGKPNVLIVPITFTSDHIETLFEIEMLYLPLLRARGLNALRCPALNLEPYWLEGLSELLREENLTTNQMLIYSSTFKIWKNR